MNARLEEKDERNNFQLMLKWKSGIIITFHWHFNISSYWWQVIHVCIIALEEIIIMKICHILVYNWINLIISIVPCEK